VEELFEILNVMILVEIVKRKLGQRTGRDHFIFIFTPSLFEQPTMIVMALGPTLISIHRK
jgi:hypothetical protein